MEAMALLAETRRYLIDRSESERKGMSVESGLAASMESMRLVARLTQVLAWLLTHRAVHAGEMTLVEATRDDRRLGGRLCDNRLRIGLLEDCDQDDAKVLKTGERVDQPFVGAAHQIGGHRESQVFGASLEEADFPEDQSGRQRLV